LFKDIRAPGLPLHTHHWLFFSRSALSMVSVQSYLDTQLSFFSSSNVSVTLTCGTLRCSDSCPYDVGGAERAGLFPYTGWFRMHREYSSSLLLQPCHLPFLCWHPLSFSKVALLLVARCGGWEDCVAWAVFIIARLARSLWGS
jgi:hypothetical protein